MQDSGDSMKKKVIVPVSLIIMAMILALLLSRCGNTWGAERIVGESSYFQYSEKDIRDAMDVVERKFCRDFTGCKLLRLEYNESRTMVDQVERGNSYGVKRTIVLISDFYVGIGAEPTFNPNQTYKDWTWILTDEGSGWQLRTWGYG